MGLEERNLNVSNSGVRNPKNTFGTDAIEQLTERQNGRRGVDDVASETEIGS